MIIRKRLAQTAMAAAIVALAGCATSPTDTRTGGYDKLDDVEIANPYGITGTIDARNAEALYKSLDQMVRPASQADAKAFMKDFFYVTTFDYCDDHGAYPGAEDNPFRGKNATDSTKECREFAGSKVRLEKYSTAYLANRRMDLAELKGYRNGFGAEWTEGWSGAESYVKFIDRYASYIDGKTPEDIASRARDIRAGRIEFRSGSALKIF